MEPPAPLKRIEPRISRIGRCILNYVLIIRRYFGVIKQKMRQNIAILLFIYCLSIMVSIFVHFLSCLGRDLSELVVGCQVSDIAQNFLCFSPKNIV